MDGVHSMRLFFSELYSKVDRLLGLFHQQRRIMATLTELVTEVKALRAQASETKAMVDALRLENAGLNPAEQAQVDEAMGEVAAARADLTASAPPPPSS